jgi:hypothetical protein
LSHPSLFRWLRRWHARIGLAAALFFLFLIVSGIALNHTDALKLDQRHIGAAWLTRWYGLRADVPTRGFKLAQQYLTWDAQKWVLQGRVIAADQPPPVGAACAGSICYIAAPETLFLFTTEGKLIDKVTDEALPALPLATLGADGERVIVGSAKGVFASTDGIDWQRHIAPVAFSQAVALPSDVAAALRSVYAPTIDSERVLLDLHSGRILGRYGPLLIDAAALALLALAVSGIWMYVRAARAQRQRDRTRL